MTPAARSLTVFGHYLCVLGPGLMLAPGPLLAPFGIASPQEIWVRVAGLLATILGVYYVAGARHDLGALIRLSVWTRAAVLPVFAVFVFAHGAPAALLLFGAVDLAGAAWTAIALRPARRLAT